MLLETEVQFSQYLGSQVLLDIIDSNYESEYLGYTQRVSLITLIQTKVLLVENIIAIETEKSKDLSEEADLFRAFDQWTVLLEYSSLMGVMGHDFV